MILDILVAIIRYSRARNTNSFKFFSKFKYKMLFWLKQTNTASTMHELFGEVAERLNALVLKTSKG